MSTQTQTTPALDSFTRAYIEAALWSSTDDNDVPLDSQYDESDIAPETLAKIVADCERFQEQCSELLTDENCSRVSGECTIDEMAGHDFWLTRNGHGAGFWDGNWNEPAATRLTDAAHAFGFCDLYVGDDGRLYI